MARQTKPQRQTVSRIMHEYKHGELSIGEKGPKVKSPRQAVAIALQEAGATNRESPRRNKRNFRRTKTKERQGDTAEARQEGREAQSRTMKRATSKRRTSRRPRRGSGASKAALYAEARRRNIAGRSSMSKAELQRALR